MLATTEWLQELITPWLRKVLSLGATTLGKKVEEHYALRPIPYMRIWTSNQRVVAEINGTSWEDRFQLLYTFKAEVEKSSPGSLVENDQHVVRYKLRGKAMEKTYWLLSLSRLAGKGF